MLRNIAKASVVFLIIVAAIIYWIVSYDASWKRIDQPNGSYTLRRMSGEVILEEKNYDESGRLKAHMYSDASYHTHIIEYDGDGEVIQHSVLQ